jgi:uncharacterized protein YcgL (UPF0745 family)
MTTTCYIYRCSAKPDMYIYLAEEGGFDKIDEGLIKKLGQLSFAMSLELDNNSKLAKEDPLKVIDNLKNQGFHLQMPSDTSVEELMARISLAKSPSEDSQ